MSGMKSILKRDQSALQASIKRNTRTPELVATQKEVDLGKQGVAVPYFDQADNNDKLEEMARISELARSLGLNTGVADTKALKDILQSRQEQTDTFEFDEWIEQIYDVSDPIQLRELQTMYPGYMERKLQQLHKTYEDAKEFHILKLFGPQTIEDMRKAYLIGRGDMTPPPLLNLSADAHKTGESQVSRGLGSIKRWYNGSTNSEIRVYNRSQLGSNWINKDSRKHTNSVTNGQGYGLEKELLGRVSARGTN
jgi:hypothetical protein